MSAIIFDFDGTIADTFETVVQIFYDLTGRHEKVSPKEIERLRSMTLLHAAEELHVRPWKMPFLLMRGRRRMSKQMTHVYAHRDVPAVIKKLHAEGHQLFIMSSNSTHNIKLFLKKHDLTAEFVEIYGSVGLLNKSKVLKKVIKRNNLDANDTWYIGDEIRDVVGAHHADVRVMAVDWGYNTADILKTYNPTKLLHIPIEIIAVLEES